MSEFPATLCRNSLTWLVRDNDGSARDTVGVETHSGSSLKALFSAVSVMHL